MYLKRLLIIVPSILHLVFQAVCSFGICRRHPWCVLHASPTPSSFIDYSKKKLWGVRKAKFKVLIAVFKSSGVLRRGTWWESSSRRFVGSHCLHLRNVGTCLTSCTPLHLKKTWICSVSKLWTCLLYCFLHACVSFFPLASDVLVIVLLPEFFGSSYSHFSSRVAKPKFAFFGLYEVTWESLCTFCVMPLSVQSRLCSWRSNDI